ncbi:MAG: penicillin-binding protein 2 [Ruminococcaceae bacterium]|nr:penicillin-binding protein 2 [Oscillospiraceae bacterium]
MNKKVTITGICLLGIFSLLAVRIGYLQLVRGEKLSEDAANQRWTEVLNQGNRGNITDRHFFSMTNAGEQWLAVVTPAEVENNDALYRQLAPFCSWTASEFQQKLAKNQIFTVPLTEEPDFSVTEGLETVVTNKRYDFNSPASHLLGYCNGGEGVSGLEAAYDTVLAMGGGISVGAVTDASGKIITDLSSHESPEQERNLRLTIDATLQNVIEETGKKEIPQGAAVLLDLHTSDILAMASFPDFDQSDISKAVSSSDGSMVNRALCAYDAGSVFKIIVAAAALEHGEDLGWYTCNGSVSVGDMSVSGYHHIAHGDLTLPEAFAKSCNCYFITLGQKLGAEKILDMAEKFGIGTPYHLFKNSGEQKDSAGEKEDYFEGELANLSIGQGQVMLTPLRVAEFSAIVASGGIRHKVNLVHSVTDGNQKTIKKISSFKQERVISKETAEFLKSMMVMTTLSGTAQTLSLDSIGGAGCKTGTAQTGWSEGETTKVHSWITGFFPAEHPKYALCIFVENGENNGISASHVFEKIIKKIKK